MCSEARANRQSPRREMFRTITTPVTPGIIITMRNCLTPPRRFFLPLDAPVPRHHFQRFLAGLPTSVFRAKGFVRFAESPEQIHTFQQVRDQAELVLLPMEEKPKVALGLVLIGPHLEEKRIREIADTSLLTTGLTVHEPRV